MLTPILPRPSRAEALQRARVILHGEAKDVLSDDLRWRLDTAICEYGAAAAEEVLADWHACAARGRAIP